MRPSSCLLTALTIAGASAGDVGKREPQWKDWEKTEKETVTVWETQWEKPETVLVTEWETKWAKPDAITVYSTVWSTQWHNQSITVTSTSTDILTATESIYVTNTATELYTETQQQIETKTATATVTSANVVHVTQLATVTDTVTKFETCSTTKSLVGLVTCPSRTINPTYTAPTTLPSNYLWGCPPGTICTPKQIDCNFEQNLPSDEFVCSPDECLAVKPLPPLPVDWDPHNCTPYYPPEGYFNLAPPIFGLDYDIFAFNGQPGPSCPPEPSSTSTGWQDWPAPASQTKGWNSWEPAKPGRVNGWKGWNGNGFPHGGRPAPPGITARAVYVERQTGPDMSVPDGCYNICNAAAANGQSCGLQASILCPSGGIFSQQVDGCQNCVDALKARAISEVPVLLPSLATFINYCSEAMQTQAREAEATETGTTEMSTTETSSTQTSSTETRTIQTSTMETNTTETGALNRRNPTAAATSTLNVQQALETSASGSVASTARVVATTSGPAPSLSTGAASIGCSTSFLLLTLGVGICAGLSFSL